MTLEAEDFGIVADDLTDACDEAVCFASKFGLAEVSTS
jgi:hypothetical protein